MDKDELALLMLRLSTLEAIILKVPEFREQYLEAIGLIKFILEKEQPESKELIRSIELHLATINKANS